MKQIFETGALTLYPCNRGFVFASVQQDESGKQLVSFNQHSFDTGITTAISKNAYLNIIYSNHTEFLKDEITDYIKVKNIFTQKFGMIIIYPDGIAKVFDYNCQFKWKGSLKYKGYAPADAVVYENSLWCSYPDSNTLIRYNTNSMRQEFKISSGVQGQLNEPCGLFANENELVITSASTGDVQQLNLNNFILSSFHSLGEPAKKYIKVDSNEVVLCKSGIYRI